MKITTNKQFTLKVRDFAKGLLIAVVTAVVTFAMAQLKDGLGLEWNALLDVTIGAAIAYLGKNFFEPTKTVVVSEDQFEAKELVNSAKLYSRSRR